VPLSKHSPPRLYKTKLFMLYETKVAVDSVIHTQHKFKIRTQILLIHSNKVHFNMISTLPVRYESPGFDV
jgi:hypothetical protein